MFGRRRRQSFWRTPRATKLGLGPFLTGVGRCPFGLLTIELDRVINEFHQLFIRFQLDVSRFSFHIFLFTGLQWVAAGPRVGFPRFLDFLFDFFSKSFT